MVAANNVPARRHGVPKMAATDWFMQELALSILDGELGNALVGVTQLTWSCRSALKILMFWTLLGGVVD